MQYAIKSPWGKQLEKWEVIFFPRLFLFPQESASLCVFLSIFFFHFAMSFLHMPWSAQLSVHINGRKTKVYLVYRYLTWGNPLDSLPLAGKTPCRVSITSGGVAGRQASSEGQGEDKQADERAAALWRPSWRGSLSLCEPSICTTCGDPDSPLPPLCSCCSFQTPSRSPPQADQSLSLGTSQRVTRSFHVYLNRKRDLTSPSWFNFSCDSESCPEHLWKQQGSPLTLKAAGSAGSPSSLIPSAPVVSELLPGLQDLCSEYIWCHFSERGRPHNDEKLALYPTVGYTRQVDIF